MDAGDALVEPAQAVLDEAGTTADNVLRVATDAVVRDIDQENVLSGGARAGNEAAIGKGARA